MAWLLLAPILFALIVLLARMTVPTAEERSVYSEAETLQTGAAGAGAVSEGVATRRDTAGAAEVNGAALSPVTDRVVRTDAMLIHLLGLFTSFLGPLIIWLLKRESHPFVDDQGREALNQHITWIVLVVAASVRSHTLGAAGIGAAGMSVPFVVMGSGVYLLVVCIIGTVRANDGVWFRYPIRISFLSKVAPPPPVSSMDDSPSGARVDDTNDEDDAKDDSDAEDDAKDDSDAESDAKDEDEARDGGDGDASDGSKE